MNEKESKFLSKTITLKDYTNDELSKLKKCMSSEGATSTDFTRIKEATALENCTLGDAQKIIKCLRELPTNRGEYEIETTLRSKEIEQYIVTTNGYDREISLGTLLKETELQSKHQQALIDLAMDSSTWLRVKRSWFMPPRFKVKTKLGIEWD